MKINELLKNPFVIAGGVGLLVYLYMKNQQKKAIPKVSPKPDVEDKQEEKSVAEEPTSKFDGLPDDFFKDVEKMDKAEIKHTIKLNQGLAKRKNLKKEERENVKLMMQYLKQEYAKR